MSGRAATKSIRPGRFALSVGMPDLAAPRGWEWVPLSSVATMATGHTPSRGEPAYWGGGIPWMSVRDARPFHGGIIDTTQESITELGLANSAAVLLPAGTVCLSRTGSIGYAVVLGRPMATSQGFVNWLCSDALDPMFLCRLFQAERESLESYAEGSAHTTIYFPEAKAFHICLPPLPEQQRIVAHLDGLLANARSAREKLATLPGCTERYRQSVLSAAFRGDMPEATSHAVDLEALVSPGRTITYGVVQTGAPHPQGVPTIRCGDIKGYRVAMDDLKRVDPEVEAQYPRTRLHGGEVVIAIRGSVGEVAVVPPALAGANVSREVAVIPVGAAVVPEYLMYLLASPVVAGAIGDQVKGVAQSGINISDLRRIRVPLPPRARQMEVVARIQRAFAAIDKITQRVAGSRSDVGRLEQSLLAKAFRGELVFQDAGANPDSMQFVRVGDERESASVTRRTRRTPAGT